MMCAGCARAVDESFFEGLLFFFGFAEVAEGAGDDHAGDSFVVEQSVDGFVDAVAASAYAGLSVVVFFALGECYAHDDGAVVAWLVG